MSSQKVRAEALQDFLIYGMGDLSASKASFGDRQSKCAIPPDLGNEPTGEAVFESPHRVNKLPAQSDLLERAGIESGLSFGRRCSCAMRDVGESLEPVKVLLVSSRGDVVASFEPRQLSFCSNDLSYA